MKKLTVNVTESNSVIDEIKFDRELIQACFVQMTKLVDKKFAVTILGSMIYLNHKRFSEFLSSIDGINQKTLSLRLREMLGSGLVKKKIVLDSPPRTEYILTEAGWGMKPILEQLARYCIEFHPPEVCQTPKNSSDCGCKK
jgi:DNA-binding HxlR family transcriptional regulator